MPYIPALPYPSPIYFVKEVYRVPDILISLAVNPGYIDRPDLKPPPFYYLVRGVSNLANYSSLTGYKDPKEQQRDPIARLYSQTGDGIPGV